MVIVAPFLSYERLRRSLGQDFVVELYNLILPSGPGELTTVTSGNLASTVTISQGVVMLAVWTVTKVATRAHAHATLFQLAYAIPELLSF
jgi:hypothetical protein